MVNLTTAFGRNGLQDWVLQRVTAIILASYTLFILGYWFVWPNADNVTWQLMFKGFVMRFATLLALLSLILHAWIGTWIIITDYIKTTALRLALKIFIFILLVFELIWGIHILWGTL